MYNFLLLLHDALSQLLTNSIEDRGQTERRSGGCSPLVRGSAQFAIRFDFVKLSGCRGLLRMYLSDFGGLGVECWPLAPKFAGSPSMAKKSSARLPSEGK
jgi:hypothetical protein